MAYKLNAFAQNLADKTNDTIETGKLNSKANSEKNLAGEELKKIGTYYYEKFTAGEEMDPAIQEYLNAAKAHYDAADAALAEIENIRQENEAQKAAAEAEKAAAQAAAEAEKAAAQAAAEAEKAAAQAAAAVEVPAAEPVTTAPVAEAPEGLICPNCGAGNSTGTKFCGECGTKLEIPQPPAQKVCASCGTIIEPGLKFCGECGTRVE